MPPVSTLEIKSKAVAALKWNYAGMAVRAFSGLLFGILLARLLGPKPFGEVAIATLVIGLGALLADGGFSAAVVQRAELLADDIRTAFTFQLATSGALALLILVLAKPLAGLFRMPQTAPVIAALALTFPLQALGQTAGALLKRRLQFRRLQMAQVTSSLCGYLALGIPLAFQGFGVWSLVAAQLAQSLLNSVLLFAFARHPVKPLLKGQQLRWMVRFGGSVMGANVFNWVILNLDNSLVGRAFGAVPLGLYSRAYNLAITPLSVVNGLQQVLFPASSRAQDDPTILRRVYLGCTALTAMCMVPGFAVIATAAHTITVGLYGEKWSGAAGMLGALAVAMPLYALVGIAGPLMSGAGKVHYELRAQAITMAAAVLLYVLAARHSALAVAWAVMFVYLIRFVLMTHAALQLFAVRWREVLAIFRGPLLSAVLLAGVARIADVMLGRAGLPVSLQLPGVLFAAAGAALLLIWLDPVLFLGSAGLAALRPMRGGLPRRLDRFLPRIDAGPLRMGGLQSPSVD